MPRRDIFHLSCLVSVVCDCYTHHNFAQLLGRLEQYRQINHRLPNNECGVTTDFYKVTAIQLNITLDHHHLPTRIFSNV